MSPRRAFARHGRCLGSSRVALWLPVLVLVLSTISGCGPAGASASGRDPQLIFDRSVGSDLQTLAQATWERFLASFAARRDCFGSVRLMAAYDLTDRSTYDPGTATVTVRVPGTAAMLQGSLVHEWAHHLEYQCPAHADLRPRFLAAQGLPPDTPWRPPTPPADLAAGDWAEIPAEQCAEATIEFVLGSRQIPTTARVKLEAVRVIADWAAGH